MDVIVGVPPYIDAIQIHSESTAAAFLSEWRGDIATMRFEVVRLADGSDAIAVDYLLSLPDMSRLLIVLGALMEPAVSLRVPSLMRTGPPDTLRTLASAAVGGMPLRPTAPDIRFLPHAQLLGLDALLPGRAIPGLCEYSAAITRIKRYRFAAANILPGPTVEYACGAGYGLDILATASAADTFTGVDTDLEVLRLAARFIRTSRVRLSTSLADDTVPDRALNVISLDALQNSPDPHDFIELLIARLARNGRIILSVPSERCAGSHLDPHHVTNWTFQRFSRLLSTYFSDYTIYPQQLSISGMDSFQHSDIYDRPINPDIDRGYIAIAQGTRRTRSLPRIVVQRDRAMGDVILTTPLVDTIRTSYPQHCLVAVTRHTDVFLNNPQVDIVATPALRLRADDVAIDLNGIYELHRALHILEAYSDAAAAVVTGVFPQPRLYLAPSKIRWVGECLAKTFGSTPVTRLVAIHAAATSPDRVWPISHWQDLISSILRDGATGIVLMGAMNDYDSRALDLETEPNVLSFVARADLQTTAAGISLCDALVCPDSGLSHVASAVGTKSLVLYGMANPATRASLTGLTDAIWSEVDCRDCLLSLPPEAPPLCRLPASICMEAIHPALVRQHLADTLAHIQAHSWRRRLRSLGIAVEESSLPDGNSPISSYVSQATKVRWWRRIRR